MVRCQHSGALHQAVEITRQSATRGECRAAYVVEQDDQTWIADQNLGIKGRLVCLTAMNSDGLVIICRVFHAG